MKRIKDLFSFKPPRMSWLPLLLVIGSLFVVSGCQHNSDENSEDNGEVTIELTDAEGDFSTYTVDVLSLTLTRKDNSTVEVLPENTRVDFAQYVEMTELLTSATVPAGTYIAASLTLDYSDADIFVENAQGDNIQVASIVDEDNNPITTLETKVTLDDRKQLKIFPGVPAHLSLDFDLKTSNSVSFDTPDEPVLTVSPILNASLEPDTEKSHRVRGPLKKVDVENDQFDLIIRPFNHRLDNSRGRFGNLRVNTGDDTVFEINGETSTGHDGILAMNELDKLTGIIVVGDITLKPRRFQATEVYAGSSVPGGDMDAVKGTVLSRNGNTLIVKGATLIRKGGSAIFNDEVSITLDNTTVVKRQNDTGEYSIDDISVGQRLTVFGTLDENTADLNLDASNGMVRMLMTSISGTVVGEKDESTSQFFALDLNNINGRKLELFDFTGTGTDAANDADPGFYEIETSTLDLTEFPLDASINVRGFVNSFGQAPADFIAKSINNIHRTFRAVMHTDWKPASNTAFSEISNEKIMLDFSGSGRFHHLGRGQRRIDLTQLSTGFAFVPATDDVDVLYVIQKPGSRRVHTTFENLSDDLNDLIAAGDEVRRVQATGTFDLTTGEFTAKTMKIKMQ